MGKKKGCKNSKRVPATGGVVRRRLSRLLVKHNSLELRVYSRRTGSFRKFRRFERSALTWKVTYSGQFDQLGKYTSCWFDSSQTPSQMLRAMMGYDQDILRVGDYRISAADSWTRLRKYK